MKDSSWEDCDVVKEMFPHLNLEDQVKFDGVRNVMEQTVAGKEAAAAAVESQAEKRKQQLMDRQNEEE